MGLTLFDIAKLGGGLAFFLYGMSMLGSGLEKLSGGRLEQTLEKMTGNIFRSMLLGAAVTAVIQSSSATTVILVGLVSAGILKLRQAIGVILGANIGTTVTGHILRLTSISGDSPFLQMIKPANFAPVVALVGIVLFMMNGSGKRKDLGEIMLGFGILFTGMFTMEAAVEPLRDSPVMVNLFTAFGDNVPLGILAGAAVTAIIQSSSASVGILQALSTTGAISYASAIPIIMGQNIGTCVTAMLAGMSGTRNAKRTAFAHLYFNIIASLALCLVLYGSNIFFNFDFWDMAIDKGGIANFHTIFNFAGVFISLPLVGVLEKLATISVGNKEPEIDVDISTLNENFFASPGLALAEARKVVVKMALLAKDNVAAGAMMLNKFDTHVSERMKETEAVINRIDDKVREYLLKLANQDAGDEVSTKLTTLLQLVGDFERMGDHACNLREYAEELSSKNISFTYEGAMGIAKVCEAVGDIMEKAVNATENDDRHACGAIEPLEKVIDEMVELLRSDHIERLRRGECSNDAGAAFVEALLNLERISDHCSNVGVYLAAESVTNPTGKHEFVRRLHAGDTEHYMETYIDYREKYYSPIAEMNRA